MKRLKSGEGVAIGCSGYEYKGFEIWNHGYFPPDKCIWWEAISKTTKCAEYHATTKRQIKKMIDKDYPD